MSQKDQLFISQEVAEELVDVNLTKTADIRAAHQQVLFEQLHGLVASTSSPSAMSLESMQGMNLSTGAPSTAPTSPAISEPSEASQKDEEEDSAHEEAEEEDEKEESVVQHEVTEPTAAEVRFLTPVIETLC